MNNTTYELSPCIVSFWCSRNPSAGYYTAEGMFFLCKYYIYVLCLSLTVFLYPLWILFKTLDCMILCVQGTKDDKFLNPCAFTGRLVSYLRWWTSMSAEPRRQCQSRADCVPETTVWQNQVCYAVKPTRTLENNLKCHSKWTIQSSTSVSTIQLQ